MAKSPTRQHIEPVVQLFKKKSVSLKNAPNVDLRASSSRWTKVQRFLVKIFSLRGKETERMKILVTGASGYLGGRVCRALLRRGYSVRILVRPTSDLSSLRTSSDDGSPEIVYGDVTDYASLLSACSGCTIIFHLAALVEPWLPDSSKFVSVRLSSLLVTFISYRFFGNLIPRKF